MYVLVTVSVVISLQTLGNVLVLALIVVPASASRLACRRLGTMMLFSPVFGVLCSTVGLYFSWAFNLPLVARLCCRWWRLCAGVGGDGGSFASACPAEELSC